MFKSCSFVRSNFLSVVCVALLAAWMGGASAAVAQDCQDALGSAMEAVTVTTGNSASKQKPVDEWDGDVLKIYTPLPGVITVTGDGDGAYNSFYTEAASGPHPLLDSARLASDAREMKVVVSAGNHCIQVVPVAGTTGDFEVFAAFTDICHLGALDDHGDSLLCATPIDVDDSDTGEISPTSADTDFDMFTFELTEAATVAIESTGSTDVAGSLFDSDGVLVDSDDNGGNDDNFLITQSLGAGRYYVQVEGIGHAEGEYGLSVSLVP